MMSLSRTSVVGVIAIAFGLLTVFSGGTALFGGPEARAVDGKRRSVRLVVQLSCRFRVHFHQRGDLGPEPDRLPP